MKFLKVYLFEKDYEQWDDEIAYAVSDFYKQFSLFPNVLYAHPNTFNSIHSVVRTSRNMKEKTERFSEGIDSSEFDKLTKDEEDIFILEFMGNLYELSFWISEKIPPRFFYLEFSITKEHPFDNLDGDRDDDDDGDNDFFPVLPKPLPSCTKALTE